MIEWLSGFLLNPALVAGAGAVASPILIHFLSKRRFRRVRWAAMDFLFQAQQHNRRRVRIEQLILLALRCLAVILIAAMVARPFLRSNSLVSLLGGIERTERIFLVDDSFSMAYQSGTGAATQGSSFDRVAAAVETIARLLSSEAGDDPVTILTTSRPDEPLVTVASLSGQNLQRLRDHLAETSVKQGSGNMAQAIAAVADLVATTALQANTTVYVVTDFQRADWLDVDLVEQSDGHGLFAPLVDTADAAEAEQRIKIVLVDVGAERPKNLAITEIMSTQPRVVAGVPARFRVAVSNYSPYVLKEVELTVSIADHTLPPMSIPTIAAWQTVGEPIEATFPGDGSDFLRVQLSGKASHEDGLGLDNTRALAVDVVPAVRILVVDGEPNEEPYLDETHLLMTALCPPGRVSSGNDISVVRIESLDGIDLEGYQVVFLANVFRLGQGVLKKIGAFVGAGGGLIVFAGDQVDATFYNDRLYADGRGLLPLPLGDVRQAPPGARPFSFSEVDSSHPAMRAFGGRLAEAIRQVRVMSFQMINEGSGTEDGVRVLARFDDPDHSPAIVSQQYGQGECVFVTTSADQEWNDWASSFGYVPMMLELVQHTAARSDFPGQCVVGLPVRWMAPVGLNIAPARVTSPDYPLTPIMDVRGTTAGAGHAAYVFSRTSKMGIYQFEYRGAAGETIRFHTAVNPDARESDLRRVDRETLSGLLDDVDHVYVRDLDSYRNETATARQELWWPLLLAVVCVLMLEHTLAWWFGTRG